MYFASGERLCLHFQIQLRINICSIERDVPEPSTDSVDVDTRAEKVGRGWSWTCPAMHVPLDIGGVHQRAGLRTDELKRRNGRTIG